MAGVKVILNSMSVRFGSDEVVMDDLDNEKFTVEVPEGIEYNIVLNFTVPDEIVSGLRFHLVWYRKGIRSDKETYMVGSYGPGKGHIFVAPTKEAPKGMMYRGAYEVNCSFLDDDKNVHKTWKWIMEVGSK